MRNHVLNRWDVLDRANDLRLRKDAKQTCQSAVLNSITTFAKVQKDSFDVDCHFYFIKILGGCESILRQYSQCSLFYRFGFTAISPFLTIFFGKISMILLPH